MPPDSITYLLPPELQQTLLELAKSTAPAFAETLIQVGAFAVGSLFGGFLFWLAGRLQRKAA